MKRFILLILILIITSLFMITSAGVINNSPTGQVGADSLSIPFYVLDSVGNIVAMVLGDSVFLNTYHPDGTLAFRDSVAFNGVNIVAQTVSSYTTYTWQDAGARLDGASPSDGVYSYILIAKDLTGSALATPFRGEFQLFSPRDYNVALDLASDTSLYMTGGAILDSIRWAQGVGIGAFSFSIRTADVDTLFSGIGTDTLWMKVYSSKLTGAVKTKVVAYSDR